ncbi:endonuclease domain-containing 1 protein-like [Pseudophryne corroboree]|uniref:endonuclease domain-containing 1 protein-like n=1 Tax=Pseudophryne corroboree TaxID=495146 RepID=UPI0030821EC5
MVARNRPFSSLSHYFPTENMKKILGLCWFSIAMVCETHARVTNDFSNCLKYFYGGHVPKGYDGIALPDGFDHPDLPDWIKQHPEDVVSPAYICQTDGNSYFATLYDRGRRIPLYSAYIMERRPNSPPAQCDRSRSFKLEPQLIYRELTANMKLAGELTKEIKNFNKEHAIDQRKRQNTPSDLIPKSQTVKEDYKNTKYQKGHLNPCGHHVTEANYQATFTLTNVVPMTPALNNVIWSAYENQMVTESNGCTTMYVITGIVPGNNKLNNRVTIPSHVWNAYCCVDNNDKPIKSGAALANNDNLIEQNAMEHLGISDLETKLKTLLRASNDIVLFHNCKPGNM